jgi:hypothetical protein
MKKKSKYGMPSPNNRMEFEHNMALIFEEGLIKSKDKKAFVNFAWAVGSELKRLKLLPNGRVNLLTINESLRLYGNSLKWMEMLPLPEIRSKRLRDDVLPNKKTNKG